MSDSLRLFLQYAANILGVGFVIVMTFSQLGDYFADHRPRHIFAALAWLVLAPVLILRTAGVSEPPRIDPQVIADGAAIGWALCLFFALCWGGMKLYEKRQEQAARQRLGLDDLHKQEEGKL